MTIAIGIIVMSNAMKINALLQLKALDQIVPHQIRLGNIACSSQAIPLRPSALRSILILADNSKFPSHQQ